jgi:hypothetical protein
MKTKMLLIFLFASVFTFAQEDVKESEIRTLAGPKGVGFYVAGAAGYSRIESKDALIIGSLLWMWNLIWLSFSVQLFL